MIDVFKYLKGLYDTDTSVSFLKPAPKEQDTRGNSLKLFKSFAKTKVRSAYFAERVVLEWNSLPDSVICAPTVNSFKSRLDSFWQNSESLYSPACLQ